eukprot:6069977-Pleurochrysis_carterae.AAC.1
MGDGGVVASGRGRRAGTRSDDAGGESSGGGGSGRSSAALAPVDAGRGAIRLLRDSSGSGGSTGGAPSR